MSQFRHSRSKIIPRLLVILLGVTTAIYLLRGFGIFSFMPGGILLILIALCLLTGIIYGIQKTKRF